MPLASRLAAGGAAAPNPYPSALQPGGPPRPPQQAGGYQQTPPYGNSPQPNYNQQQYNRPPPPPPQGSPYPGQPSFGQSQQPYSPQPYQPSPQYGQQGPSGGYGYGGPPPPQGGYQQGPPQGQYGQQSYGAPPPQMGGAGPQDIQGYQRELERAVQEKGLQVFYPADSPKIAEIAQRAAGQVNSLCSAWRIQKEIANDIVRLGLYDVVIYIDDSGSMQFEEQGSRIDDLKLILKRAAFAATLFDDDGIDIRFMNEDLPPQEISHIRNEQQVDQIMKTKRFKGLTPFGTELRKKIVDPILIPRLRVPPNPQGKQKPLLIISITDGQPAGEGQNTLIETVQYAVQSARNSPYGSGAVAFQFAQVGNDNKATEFLAKLDNDINIGNEVDCTSNYENEQVEMSQAHPPVELTPDLWMIKLILGAIDPSYDTKDEKANMAPGAGVPARPPQQGYGGPPQYGQQSQYGGPPGQQQYGGPPSGEYGQQYGGRPGQQGGYGRPPPGPPQQGGYGRPPPGPPQQGGYGAPPPPRY